MEWVVWVGVCCNISHRSGSVRVITTRMTGVSMSPRSESLGQRGSCALLAPNAISRIVPNIHIGSRNRATRVCAAERSSQARPANAVARFVVRAAQGSTLGMLPATENGKLAFQAGDRGNASPGRNSFQICWLERVTCAIGFLVLGSS